MTQISIHEYLRERRLEMKLSIQQVAKESGISAPHISRMERGVRNPSPQTLERLAPVLGVDYVTLLKVANLLENPNNHCIDLESVLKNDICMYREKELNPQTKMKLLHWLQEHVK